jgi:monoamine oxidase
VVGGDLAGMVVARELALRHWRVMLLEHATRLGGKYALGARGASAV